MKIACVSASNTRLSGESSTSVMVCHKIKEMIQRESGEDTAVSILPLRDYDIKPCTLCGACCKSGRCIYDGEFNEILEVLEEVQGIFLVVPHYSPIPAKLLMIFEKINEITYAGWINDPEYQSPFCNKPAAVIGHGGMVDNEENRKYYHDQLVTPVANTLRALSFDVVKLDEEFPNGAVFGLRDDSCLRKTDRMVFPEIVQDWPMIEGRIEPLVANAMKEIHHK